MARKKVTKSSLIRKFVADMPNAGPTEIAKALKDKHDITVTAAMVSTVKSQDKSRGGSPKRIGRPVTRMVTPAALNGSHVSVEAMLKVKKVANEIGGIQEAKHALNALEQLIS